MFSSRCHKKRKFSFYSNKIDTISQNNNFSACFETCFPVYKYKFKWKFHNFSVFSDIVKLCAPDFRPVPEKDWYIEFKKENYIYMYLCNNEAIAVNIHSDVYFTDMDGKVYFEHETSVHKNKELKLDLIPSLNSDTMDEIRNLANDVLIIICDLKLQPFNTPAVKLCNTQLEIEKEQYAHMVSDLKKLYDETIYSDVILRVEGESIRAHKAILGARSSKFAKMFKHELQESGNNVIEIEDVSASTVKQFVSLLYYPVINDSLDLNELCDLYHAADKYEVLILQDYISKILLNRMRENNSLRLLALADRHNDEHFKLEVMKFVKFHFKSIAKYDLWKDFVISNSKLAADLMSEYLEEL